jgi:hypothetical protein
VEIVGQSRVCDVSDVRELAARQEHAAQSLLAVANDAEHVHRPRPTHRIELPSTPDVSRRPPPTFAIGEPPNDMTADPYNALCDSRVGTGAAWAKRRLLRA